MPNMKHIIENAIKNFYDTDKTKQLLSDLDDLDSDINDINITSKNINTKIVAKDITLRHYLKKLANGNIWDTENDIHTIRFINEINNPKNYLKYAAVVPVETPEQLITVINNASLVLGDDGNFNWIDTSNITSMKGLCKSLGKDFNGHIELWDVSNVTDMSMMFYRAAQFNQPIGDWDVSNVQDFSLMFGGAINFNQNIEQWNTKSAIEMQHMFGDATKFNQPLNNWDVSNVSNFSGMFQNACSFNQPLDKWNIKSAGNLNSMFAEATGFTQDISNWKIPNGCSIAGMFKGLYVTNNKMYEWHNDKMNEYNKQIV